MRSLGLAVLCGALLLGCVDPVDFHYCDIRDADCREDIFLAVQRVRGTAWDPWIDLPPMRVITKEQYRAELEADNAVRAKQPSGFDYTTPAYKLFNLIDPDEAEDGNTSFTVSFVAAYYDSSTDGVTVIDRGQDAKNDQDTETLAHELVHAAQQRDVGFGRIASWGRNYDSSNALGALVEGEAMLYANLVGLIARKQLDKKIDWAKYHRDRIMGTRDGIAKDASPWRLARSALRYPLGSQYLTSAWLEGGPSEVRRALSDHPSETLRLMGERHSKLDQVVPGWRCKSPAPPTDYKLIVESPLGAWGLYAFATRFAGDEPAAWDFGEDWRGDWFSVYANADNVVTATWQVRVSSSERAEALVAGVRAATKLHLDVAIEGDRVSFVAANDPELWNDTTDWQSCIAP